MYNVIVVSPDRRVMVYNFEYLYHAQNSVIDMVVGRAAVMGENKSVSELRNRLILNNAVNYAGWQWHIHEIEG